jgi:hypothetical protein
MPRVLHITMLRNAALLVPATERAAWLAEWRAELAYVEHGATAFCLGSFRDALWLRGSSLSARRIFTLESPLRCLLLLTSSGALILAFAVSFRKLWLPSWSGPSGAQLAFGFLWVYLLSLVVLATLNPLALGKYPANRFAPSLAIRLRRWLFLVVKISLLVPIVWFASVAPQSVFPPAVWMLFFGWIFAFRWALADQRRRCPVCLRPLSNPVEVGNPAHMLLEPCGTELVCARGHGSLHIPGIATTWGATQTWQYKDPSQPAVNSRP